jgi:hypothetical protein
VRNILSLFKNYLILKRPSSLFDLSTPTLQQDLSEL